MLLFKSTYTGTGCQSMIDDTWGIQWQYANAGTTAAAKCPGLSESSAAGNVIHMIVHCTVPNVCSFHFRTCL